jgi:hypothetical protein
MTITSEEIANSALLVAAQGSPGLTVRVDLVVHLGRGEPDTNTADMESSWLSILCEALLLSTKAKVPPAKGQAMLTVPPDGRLGDRPPTFPANYPGQRAVSVHDVTEALRHVDELPYLGRHPLAALRCVTRLVPCPDATHLERGRALRAVLVEVLDMLKPVGVQPSGPLPREWYGYVILHNAYFQDVPNRHIMSQLFISEGTFNRVRRAAVESIARALAEREAVLW